jgi:hypothetical protein
MGDIITLYEKTQELTLAHNNLIKLLIEKKLLNKEDFINETS